MIEKEYIELSEKSLKIILDWCSFEGNVGTPLCELWNNAHSMVLTAIRREPKIVLQIKKTWKGKNQYGYAEEVDKVIRAAFVCRDAIGDVILDLIKRSATNGATK